MVAGTFRAAAGEDREHGRRPPWTDAARAPGPHCRLWLQMSSELRVPAEFGFCKPVDSRDDISKRILPLICHLIFAN